LCPASQECLPHAEFYKRAGFPLKKIVQFASERDFTDLLVFNEDARTINGMLLVHLPDGPTAHFRLSSLKLGRDIKARGDLSYSQQSAAAWAEAHTLIEQLPLLHVMHLLACGQDLSDGATAHFRLSSFNLGRDVMQRAALCIRLPCLEVEPAPGAEALPLCVPACIASASGA
jgi:hypothetical protein